MHRESVQWNYAREFSDLGEEIDSQTQVAFRTPNGHDQRRNYIITKMSKLQSKEAILKAVCGRHVSSCTEAEASE